MNYFDRRVHAVKTDLRFTTVVQIKKCDGLGILETMYVYIYEEVLFVVNTFSEVFIYWSLKCLGYALKRQAGRGSSCHVQTVSCRVTGASVWDVLLPPP